MSYPPKHYQETNFKHIISTIKAYPLATVISVKDSKVLVTHLPLTYKETKQGAGKLIGHIDKANPQTSLLSNGNPCTIIFNGPDSYISPSIFESKQLPTWNYIKIHIEGSVSKIENANEVKESIVNMTAQLEGLEQKFVLDKNDVRMERLIDFIEGFEVDITSWEGKFKISQDKPNAEQMLAKSALENSEPTHKLNYINSIFDS
jgi:transcriptional regulator